MNSKFLQLLLLFALCTGMTACGDSIEAVDTIEPGEAPEWFLDAVDEDDEYVYGYATAGSKQMQLSLDKARAAAKTRLSQRITETVNVKVRREVASVGALEEGTEENINRYAEKAELISDTTMRDAQEYKRKFAWSEQFGGYQSFICIRVRKDSVVENVKETLRNETSKVQSPQDRKKLESMLDNLDSDSFFK